MLAWSCSRIEPNGRLEEIIVQLATRTLKQCFTAAGELTHTDDETDDAAVEKDGLTCDELAFHL